MREFDQEDCNREIEAQLRALVAGRDRGVRARETAVVFEAELAGTASGVMRADGLDDSAGERWKR